MVSTFSNKVLATVGLFQVYILILFLYSMMPSNQNISKEPRWYLSNATSTVWTKYVSSTLSTGASKLAVHLPSEAPMTGGINSSQDSGNISVDSAEVDVSEVDKTAREVHGKLSALPLLYGWQKKEAMLEPDKWMKEFAGKRAAQVMAWINKPLVVRKKEGRIQPPAMPPGCSVAINHHYKFIWIKGKKVGGSSLRENVGNICNDYFQTGPEPNMTYCTSQTWRQLGNDVEKVRDLWKDYVVFGFIRNPYTRFASSYKYIGGMMAGGHCKRPTFMETCKNIFAQAQESLVRGCGGQGRAFHHLQHMMEATSCLFTRDGELVVDFIGRTEYLTEDYQELAREVNRRLGDSNLKLNVTKPVRIVNSTTKKPKSEAEYIFEEHPECLKDVEDAFAVDFKTFGYFRNGNGSSNSQ